MPSPYPLIFSLKNREPPNIGLKSELAFVGSWISIGLSPSYKTNQVLGSFD
jgi:hypothetical protein